MSGVKIGIGFGQWKHGLPEPHLLCEYAEASEAVGLDSLWLSDHLHMKREQLWITAGRPVPPEVELAPFLGAWECWSLIAALAVAIPNIELGTLVTCTAFGSRLPSVAICQNGKKLVPSHNDHSHQRDGPGA